MQAGVREGGTLLEGAAGNCRGNDVRASAANRCGINQGCVIGQRCAQFDCRPAMQQYDAAPYCVAVRAIVFLFRSVIRILAQ